MPLKMRGFNVNVMLTVMRWRVTSLIILLCYLCCNSLNIIFFVIHSTKRDL